MGSVMVTANDHWEDFFGVVELAVGISYDDGDPPTTVCFAVGCLQVLLPNTFLYRKSKNQSMG